MRACLRLISLCMLAGALVVFADFVSPDNERAIRIHDLSCVEDANGEPETKACRHFDGRVVPVMDDCTVTLASGANNSAVFPWSSADTCKVAAQNNTVFDDQLTVPIAFDHPTQIAGWITYMAETCFAGGANSAFNEAHCTIREQPQITLRLFGKLADATASP